MNESMKWGLASSDTRKAMNWLAAAAAKVIHEHGSFDRTAEDCVFAACRPCDRKTGGRKMPLYSGAGRLATTMNALHTGSLAVIIIAELLLLKMLGVRRKVCDDESSILRGA